MREILFRGKRIDNGEWVYGFYVETLDIKNEDFLPPFEKKKYIFTSWEESLLSNEDNGGIFEIKPETIGQFTGLCDKNGNKIFEGDKFAGDEPGEYYAISWNEEEATFQANLYGYNVSYGEGSQEIYEDEVTCIDTNCFELSALSSDVIIGNIHDNEKLKQ